MYSHTVYTVTIQKLVFSALVVYSVLRAFFSFTQYIRTATSRMYASVGTIVCKVNFALHFRRLKMLSDSEEPLYVSCVNTVIFAKRALSTVMRTRRKKKKTFENLNDKTNGM